MRFVGYIQGGVRQIGTVLDAAVTPVGTIESFYEDPAQHWDLPAPRRKPSRWIRSCRQHRFP